MPLTSMSPAPATPPPLAQLCVSESSDLDECYAKLLWSLLVEPGDRMAGALVRELGAACIHSLLAGKTSQVLAAFAQQSGELPGAEWRGALDRWQARREGLIERADRVIHAAHALDTRIVCAGDAQWPIGLDDLGDHAPFVLWLRGNFAALSAAMNSLAIVGSRAATSSGATIAGELGAQCADAGIAVISGGAYGIDTAAHRGALSSDGATIAVLAGGVDRTYPSGNRELFERILEMGLLLSEVAPGTAPTRWRFLQRNRLIAAMSRATVVVEAGARSGALNTAHHALELGRPLGAVPGSTFSAASVGPHRLIREGTATLVSTAAEVLELQREGFAQLGPAQLETASVGGAGAGATGVAVTPTLFGDTEFSAPEPSSPRSSSVATRVWDALGARKARPIEAIAEIAGLSAAEARSGLAELLLDGSAVRTDLGWRRGSASPPERGGITNAAARARARGGVG